MAVKGSKTKSAGDAEEGIPLRGRSPRGPSKAEKNDRGIGADRRSGRSLRGRTRAEQSPTAGQTEPLPSLIGHTATWELLQRLIERKRLPAAVLLSGAPGIGKRTLALSVAGKLFGVSTENAIAIHPDVLQLIPMEDAAMRDRLVGLLSHVHARPMRSDVRIILIEDVDRLSPSAAALLLKAIEDAPAYAKFLLTASILDRVVATVRSRSLTRALMPVPEQQLADALRSRGVENSEELARLSGGRPGLALRMAADPELLSRYRLWSTALTEPGASTTPLVDDDAEMAQEFFVFLESQLRRGTPSASLVRRTREAEAMLRQHVPPRFVVEYVVKR